MTKEYFLPPAFFDEIKEFAEKEGYKELLAIVDKQEQGNIVLEVWEADMLLKVAQLWKLQAEFRYPFWDEDHPNYNPDHEEGYFEEQEERFGKIGATFLGDD